MAESHLCPASAAWNLPCSAGLKRPAIVGHEAAVSPMSGASKKRWASTPTLHGCSWHSYQRITIVEIDQFNSELSGSVSIVRLFGACSVARSLTSRYMMRDGNYQIYSRTDASGLRAGQTALFGPPNISWSKAVHPASNVRLPGWEGSI